MTINDLICHKKSLRDVYKQLPFVSIVEAGKEPLKLGDLVNHPRNIALLNGKLVDYGVALCAACLSHIDARYVRKTYLTEDDKQFIAERMVAQFKHWSVLDLPCFESMLIGARIPTLRNGQMEYELSGINIPSILSKAEAYDRMRPNPQALQGGSPIRSDEKPLTDYQLHHLIDGTPYDFPTYQAAYRYWRSPPDPNDPRDQAFIEGVMKKVRSCSVKFHEAI